MGDDGRPFHRYYSGGSTIRTVFAFARVCVWGGGMGNPFYHSNKQYTRKFYINCVHISTFFR